MAQFAADVCGTHIATNALHPGGEWNAGNMAVSAPRYSVPHSDSNVLHNVVRVGRPANASEVRNDISAYAVDGDHDLIHWNCERGRLRSPAQGDINVNLGWLIVLGLIRPGFDSHGLHRFE